jgi:hypothetical protein
LKVLARTDDATYGPVCSRGIPHLALLLAPCGCAGSTNPRIDLSRCQHTGEFDNYGCAVVAGPVTNATAYVPPITVPTSQ